MQNLLNNISLGFIKVISNFGVAGVKLEGDIVASYPWLGSVLNPILGILEAILLPLLIIIGTAGSIYAVVLGVNYSRAETADKREEAKKRMINAVVGIIAMIFLLIILQLFVSNAPAIVKTITGFGTEAE